MSAQHIPKSEIDQEFKRTREHLSRLSVEAEEPERGLEWVLLAIDSLAANSMLETEPGRAALAWARLARARWRAGVPSSLWGEARVRGPSSPMGSADLRPAQ